jgi:dihydroxyacetone kinase-like predicted kinase
MTRIGMMRKVPELISRSIDWATTLASPMSVLVFDCSTTLLAQLVTADRELLTVITGDDADPVVTSRIIEWLSANHPGVAVEVHRGGQPLYPYLFGVE